ncbi:MAG: histidinol dehydrogenase [Desulfovibrio sp.]|jgi:histidinol dehydrogenase|nr:histidinol dehydrogenase [Desulfovibrio sp.]
MQIPLYSVRSPADAEEFQAVPTRRAAAYANTGGGVDAVAEQVAEILEQVRSRGLEAVLEYTRRFDAPEFREEQFAPDAEDLDRTASAVPAHDLAIIRRAWENIRAFHEHDKEQSRFETRPEGGIVGRLVRPVDRAGLYVPGGKGGETPLVSSLLMGAAPALAAGVPEIAVVTPPRRDGSINPHIAAAARMIGLKEIYAAGSAWAVAALAYGAGPLRAVDVVAGPGNIHVAAAKHLLRGRVGVDMVAGPSEICIVADASAPPAWIAADMLAQAEHDELASAVLICTEETTAQAVRLELERRCPQLPRSAAAQASLARYGAIIRVPDTATAMALVNRIAPEHLELVVGDPWSLLHLVRNAGAVFLGGYSAEVFGDYCAGPNHVLPTMGTARFSSGLSVSTFCKKSSLLALNRAFAADFARDTAALARLEGLEAHAQAALCRLEDN